MGIIDRIAAFRPPPTRYCPHIPTPKQWAALTCVDPELLFGGAAGGGKSDYLLMAALQYIHEPSYAALLIRRTWTDLNRAGAILDRAHSWWRDTDAKWEAAKGWYRFPSGATISFGHLFNEKDKLNYQGAEYQFIGVDELTHFPESQYSYLTSRLRRLEGSFIPLRARAGSNPGGPGHEWVARRFVFHPEDGCRFIPSRLEDNPHLDRAEYEQTLSRLDPVTRAQLRHGDWSVRPDGDLFKRDWFALVDVPPERPRYRVRFWDLASTEAKPGQDPDWTAGALMSWHEGTFYLEDVRAIRDTPAKVEDFIRRTSDQDARLQSIESFEVLLEEEGGASGKALAWHYTSRVLAGHNARTERSTGDKVFYARPLSSIAEGGSLRLVRAPWNDAFINEAVAFPLGGHDDRIDAASKAHARIAARLRATHGGIGKPVQVGAGRG
jgi:predicted phage terminase large subunit-like protein